MIKMSKCMTALQTRLAAQQPNYPDNAESVLEVLFDAIANPAALITQPSKPTSRNSTGS